MDKQEEIVKILKELKDSDVITDEIFKKMKPSVCQPGVLYGLCKVHKSVGINGEPPLFRPIISAINTPSYNLAKFLLLKYFNNFHIFAIFPQITNNGFLWDFVPFFLIFHNITSNSKDTSFFSILWMVNYYCSTST